MSSNTLEEIDWKLLLGSIKDGKCTPFIGAGACHGVLPLASEIAEDWAKEYGYPLKDTSDLARVAQFLAVKHRHFMFPKEEILKKFKGRTPNFTDYDEPHAVLAALPLPIYNNKLR